MYFDSVGIKMAKRPPLKFELPKTPTKKAATDRDNLLSPSKITTPDEHATVTGSLSPIKPSRYFDGELTDGESVVRLVGFDKAIQRQLRIPVTLRNCQIQKNKFKDELEVVLKAHTKIEQSHEKFEVLDLKTVESALISLGQLDEIVEHQRVTIRIKVVKVNDALKVGTKTKQDVLVADNTGKATVTLWESNINALKQSRSYQLNRLEVRVYMERKHLFLFSKLARNTSPHSASAQRHYQSYRPQQCSKTAATPPTLQPLPPLQFASLHRKAKRRYSAHEREQFPSGHNKIQSTVYISGMTGGPTGRR